MTTKGWFVFALLFIAVVLFFTASVGWFPDDLRKDIEPVAMGFVFLDAAFGVHLFMHGGELAA